MFFESAFCLSDCQTCQQLDLKLFTSQKINFSHGNKDSEQLKTQSQDNGGFEAQEGQQGSRSGTEKVKKSDRLRAKNAKIDFLRKSLMAS